MIIFIINHYERSRCFVSTRCGFRTRSTNAWHLRSTHNCVRGSKGSMWRLYDLRILPYEVSVSLHLQKKLSMSHIETERGLR